MTERTMKLLIEMAGDDYFEGEGLEECRDYSGRGMYGETTCGLRFSDMSTLLEAIAQAAFEMGMNQEIDAASGCGRDREAWREFRKDVRGMRFDSLGMGKIAY